MNRLLLPRVAFWCVVVAAAPALRAADGDLIMSEDFESTPVGQIPAGYTKTGPLKVVDTVAHSGKHSLEIEPIAHGPRFLSLSADQVAALGSEQWGRFYYKVKTPAPSPAPNPAKKTALIHATFVFGEATSPLEHDHTQVRLAGLNLNKAGQFHYLYNVQPKGGRKEFGEHSKNLHTFGDDWVLVEWHADYATQSYALYVNGSDTPEVEFSKGAGNFKGAEIPEKFQTFSIGFTNYQAATGKGFTVWLDDIAIGKKRLGPVAAK